MRLFEQGRRRTRAAVVNLLSRFGATKDGDVPQGRGAAAGAMVSEIAKQFQVSYERSAIHKDLHRMDSTDEIVAFILNAIADRTTGMDDPTLDSFEVTVQAEDMPDGTKVSDELIRQADWEIKQLIKRLRLREDCWQIVRRFVKWGNEFREVLIDPQTLNIMALKELPEHTMWPNVDEMGTRQPGYKQIPENATTITEGIQFAEWEILHFAFGERNGYLGTPLLGCARKNWKRINLAEDMTAAARIIRAFMKIVHRVPVNSDWSMPQQQEAIEIYKKNMSKRNVFDQDENTLGQENAPQSVFTDFFIPDDGSKRGGVEMLDPENAQLQNINDIKHFIDRLIAASSIPKRYFPFEGSTPKLSEGGGNAEDKHFACTLMRCQMIVKQVFSELFDRQLLLKGINPEQVRYVIRMSSINVTDELREAQTELALADTMDTLLAKYPELRDYPEVMFREFTRMSDASKSSLAGMKLKELPELGDGNPGENTEGKPARKRDKRTQLPGMGNPDARKKI